MTILISSLLRTRERATYPIPLGTVGQSNHSNSFLMLAPCVLQIAIGRVQRVVDSTAPVFSDGSDRVGERRLPVRKLEEEGVVVTVLDGCQLPVDDAGTLVKGLSDDDVHVAKREEIVDIIFERYG